MPLGTVMIVYCILVLGDEGGRECDAHADAILGVFAAFLLARMVPYSYLVGRMLYGIVKGYPPVWRQVYHVVTIGGMGVWVVVSAVLLGRSKRCRESAETLYVSAAVVECLAVVWVGVDLPFTLFLEGNWFVRWQVYDNVGEDEEYYDDYTIADPEFHRGGGGLHRGGGGLHRGGGGRGNTPSLFSYEEEYKSEYSLNARGTLSYS